jgi:hypothetical protein
MRKMWLALVAVIALLAAGYHRTTASSPPPIHSQVAGSVVGTLVRGGTDAGYRPVADRSFGIRLVGGGVFEVTTNARGRFRFRGRPGTDYPAFAVLGSRSDLAAFRIVAGRTTHVVVNSDSYAWAPAFS